MDAISDAREDDDDAAREIYGDFDEGEVIL